MHAGRLCKCAVRTCDPRCHGATGCAITRCLFTSQSSSSDRKKQK